MASRPSPFPRIEGNFVPVPTAVLDHLLAQDLSRAELVVTLLLVRQTYDLSEPTSIVGLDTIVQATGLTAEQAEEGLRAAIARGSILPFRSEGGEAAKKFFLLNTDENRRLAGLFDQPHATATPVIAPPDPSPVLPSPPRPVPVAGRRASGPRGLTAAVTARIVGLLGREMTRDETERLSDLGLAEEKLVAAIDALVAKNIDIYSSDQVLYEHESLQAMENKRSEDQRRRQSLEAAKARTKSCRKCNGVGYIFLGAGTIKDCDCRKGR